MSEEKGFTLIEIIGVVIVIGILAIIAFNVFTSNLKEFRDDYYTNLERTLAESGKEFFNDNRRFRPGSIFTAQKVTIDVLQKNSFISDIKDYNGKNCQNDSYVIVIKEGKDDYTYHSCLVCKEDSYDNTSNSLCDPSWFDPSTISYGLGTLPTLYIYKGTPRSKLRDLLEIPISIIKKDNEGNIIREISGLGIDDIPTVLPKDIDKVNPDKVGIYEVNYEYYHETQDGEDKEERVAKVIVYEHNAPTVKIDYKNIMANNLDGETSIVTGTYTEGQWVQEITITLTPPKDGNGKIIEIPEPGVKIEKYQWNKNGRWQDLCPGTLGSMNKDATCVVTERKEMNQDEISFRIIDSNGKISHITNPISIKIDNTKPTCTLKRNKENPDGANGWYVTPVTISFDKNEDLSSINTLPGSGNAVSGVRTSNINNMSLPPPSSVLDRNNSNNNILHSDDTKGVEYRGYVEDQAGNFYICKTSFKKDSTTPTCILSLEGTIGDNNWYTSNVTVSISSHTDNLSGVTDYGIGSYSGAKSLVHTIDTAGITYTGHIIDNAGNTATCSNAFKKDGTKPACSLSLSGTIGNNSWYTSNVGVSFETHTDNLSGVAKYGIGGYDGNKSLTHTADTSNITYTGYIKDNAGNTANCSKNFKKDGTKPVCTISLSGTVGDNSWYTSNVGVSFGSSTDNLSGVAKYGIGTLSGNKTINHTTDTEAVEYKGHIIDNAGNTGTCSNTFKKDGTKPACSLSLSGTIGNNSWYTSNVGVSFETHTDNLSGVAKYGIGGYDGNKSLTHTADTSNITYTGYIKDNAGNTANCSKNFKKDGTKPVCTISLSGTVGDNSWYTSNVGVSFGSSTDNLSGVAKYGIGTLSGNKTINHTTDTEAVEYKGHIIDNAGNTGTCSNTFKKDGTKPTCSLTLSGTMGKNGWYKSNVGVSFERVDDNLSGVAKYGIGSINGGITTSHTTDTTGTSYTGYIKDNAGNNSSCSVTFKKDGTNPTISWSVNHSLDGDGSYHSSSGISVTGTCHDATSGTSGKTTKTISSPTPSSGSTVNATCEDNAGNSMSFTSPSYKVKKEYYNNCDKCGCATYRECTHRDCGTYSCNCSTSSYKTCSDPYLSGYPSCNSGYSSNCGTTGNRDEVCCTCSKRTCQTCNKKCRTAACGCETCSTCWNY